jgi:DNA-binding SARP family transcriptional activator
VSLPLERASEGAFHSVRPVPRVEIRLLDGFELRLDGRAISLPSAAQRVVALLALHDRPMLRAYAAGLLWPESADERASANLRSALWRLRRLPFPLVDASHSHLRLAAGVVVDARELAERATAVLRGAVVAALEDARRISGAADLLPGWYEDWLVFERERFRQLQLHALEALSRLLAASGRFAEAVESGLAAVAAEPLRESAHRCLINAYLAEGNAGEALRQFVRYRDLLRAELDLAPSEQMERLFEGFAAGLGSARGR